MTKRVCSWCGCVLGYKPGPHGTTHGICLSCTQAVLRAPKGETEFERECKRLGIEAPVGGWYQVPMAATPMSARPIGGDPNGDHRDGLD